MRRELRGYMLPGQSVFDSDGNIYEDLALASQLVCFILNSASTMACKAVVLILIAILDPFEDCGGRSPFLSYANLLRTIQSQSHICAGA
jgi:hypothetical protein